MSATVLVSKVSRQAGDRERGSYRIVNDPLDGNEDP